MPPKPFKFVVIADTHIGDDKPNEEGQIRTLSSRATSLLRYLVNRVNSEIRPSFLVHLGNLIENDADGDAEIDEDNYTTALDILKQATVPVHRVIGDCDQQTLGQDKIRSLVNQKKLYYSFDAEGYHFVVLFASAKDHAEIRIDEAQRQWLIDDLKNTEKPTVVFSHHPIDDQDVSETYQFAEHPERCFVEDAVQIREILARSGKVRAVFNGHVHRNNLQVIDGINYVTVQSLVENLSDTRKLPSESFAVVSLTENQMLVEIEGMDPAEYRV